MKRILIIITTAFVPYGGLTTVMMNYYRAMEKRGLKIDVASTNEPPKKLLAELHKNGSDYFNLGSRKKHPIRYGRNLARLLGTHSYDAVHVNGNSATMAFELKIAKKKKVPVRIAHGHASRGEHPLLHRWLSGVFERSYTLALAASDQAGIWLFGGNPYIVLNNAICVKKYQYDRDIRESCRRELGLSDRFVAGNVGKLNWSKNHVFLMQIFCELKKRETKAHLLLVGDGQLREEIESLCRQYGMEGEVTFLGMRDDVPELLQAMDVFVFPSLSEGLGMALVEAQAAGLCCFASENVPKETKLSSQIEYISLEEQAHRWAEKILQADCRRRTEHSQQACAAIRAGGYDIETAAGKLREIYNGIG